MTSPPRSPPAPRPLLSQQVQPNRAMRRAAKRGDAILVDAPYASRKKTPKPG